MAIWQTRARTGFIRDVWTNLPSVQETTGGLPRLLAKATPSFSR